MKKIMVLIMFSFSVLNYAGTQEKVTLLLDTVLNDSLLLETLEVVMAPSDLMDYKQTVKNRLIVNQSSLEMHHEILDELDHDYVINFSQWASVTAATYFSLGISGNS